MLCTTVTGVLYSTGAVGVQFCTASVLDAVITVLILPEDILTSFQAAPTLERISKSSDLRIFLFEAKPLLFCVVA